MLPCDIKQLCKDYKLKCHNSKALKQCNDRELEFMGNDLRKFIASDKQEIEIVVYKNKFLFVKK